MSGFPPTHRGQDMDDFVVELSRMAFLVGYPHDPEYTMIRPLSGEFPHRVSLELHGIPTVLPNMVVTASGGTFEHACQEAAYRLMTRIREKHDVDLRHTSYRYHPSRGSHDSVSSFRSASGENDTTFGRMCAVLQGLDTMHSNLHKASKALNDRKLVEIARLKDEVARLKRENAILQGRSPPRGVRIRTMPRKSTTALVRIQLAHRNPPPAPEPLPVFVPPSPPPSPVPPLGLDFASTSAAGGATRPCYGWLSATPSSSRGASSSSSSSEPGSGETYLLDSRSRSQEGEEPGSDFASTDRRSRSE